MADIPPNFYRISVKALVLNERQHFLLTKEDNGIWNFPGGGIDYGETPHDCIKRELQEEMGIKVAGMEDRPAYFVTEFDRFWRALVLYETRLQSLNFTPTAECTELRFFSKTEAEKENLYPGVRKFLEVFDPATHGKNA